jgi:hypothetical protein
MHAVIGLRGPIIIVNLIEWRHLRGRPAVCHTTVAIRGRERVRALQFLRLARIIHARRPAGRSCVAEAMDHKHK